MRSLYNLSNKSLIAVELGLIKWLPKYPKKALLLPIGSNTPEKEIQPLTQNINRIGIYCISQGSTMQDEINLIHHTLLNIVSSLDNLELVLCGSGSDIAENILKKKIVTDKIKITSFGEVEASQISTILNSCRLLLCLRGTLTATRSSAISCIAAKVPIVAIQGELTGRPLTESGIIFAQACNHIEIAKCALSILNDYNLYLRLINQNDCAYKNFFNWGIISKILIEGLELNDHQR